MKSTPLLKLHLRTLPFFLRIPAKHGIRVIEADFFAIGFDDAVWVVEEVVCVDECDAHLLIVAVSNTNPVAVAIGVAICDVLKISILRLLNLSGDCWPNLSHAAEVVKDSSELIVPCLRRIELIKTCELVKRWDGTSIVRWDA